MLLIPITNVVFDERCEYGKQYLDDEINHTVFRATLSINDEPVGSIPYMSEQLGFMYDTNNVNIEWDKVYRQYQNVIFKKIAQQQPLAFIAEIRSYGSLFIKDEAENVINLAFCNYIGDEWEVIVTGLNVVERIKRHTVLVPRPKIKS